MKKPHSIGAVSVGTLVTDELIDAFTHELRRVAKSAGCLKKFRPLIKEANEATDDETGFFIVDELMVALNSLAMPYCYFGTHHGDGADFGFWVDWDQLNEDQLNGELRKVSDLADLPKGFTGMALLVNDHGNATLYNVARGRAREVWSVV